jgi:hypothetical protein
MHTKRTSKRGPRVSYRKTEARRLRVDHVAGTHVSVAQLGLYVGTLQAADQLRANVENTHLPLQLADGVANRGGLEGHAVLADRAQLGHRGDARQPERSQGCHLRLAVCSAFLFLDKPSRISRDREDGPMQARSQHRLSVHEVRGRPCPH